MSWFSIFSGAKTDERVKELFEQGAVILDVRTTDEFAGGHVKGSKNIPLHVLQAKLKEIKSWNKPVIACCRSGNRSGMAESILKQNGIEVVNGGSWQQVQQAIS
ncbi:rhodanese-like domain-containing protein [bacterium]|nr:rhodanese-like domain-containing protein [bacterium]